MNIPDVARHQDEFSVHGLTVLEGVFPPDLMRKTCDVLLGAEPSSVIDVDLEPDEETLTYGGITRYSEFNYPTLLQVCPEVASWYSDLLPAVRDLTRLEAIQSPYHESKVLALLYKDNGGQQEYHLDTQSITVLLYLNDNPLGGQTRGYRLSDGAQVDIYPRAGNILLMRGREVRHCGMPVTSGFKLVMPMNYYVEGDTWRPKALLDPEYWNKRKTREAVSA